jgi:hypothetical protein
MDKQLGLYKIDYEIEGESRMKDTMWSVGILAYDSEEAVKCLAKWLRKPFKIDTLSFQGPCHAVSDQVQEKLGVDLSKKTTTPKKKITTPQKRAAARKEA